MLRPRSLHERPRYRKRTDRSKPSRNATTFTPPQSESVEVEVLGMASGMKRIDQISVEASEPPPPPEPEPAPEPTPKPEEAPAVSLKVSPKPEPILGAHLGRHK